MLPVIARCVWNGGLIHPLQISRVLEELRTPIDVKKETHDMTLVDWVGRGVSYR